MRYKTNIYLLFLVPFLLLTMYAEANDPTESNKKPLNIQFQYAGNLGLVSAGMGKPYFNDKLDLYFIYGYLPKNINGATVHTIALKTTYSPFITQISPKINLNYYTGMNALYSITRNTFLKYPDYFPDGYYNSNAFHMSFYLGLRAKFNTMNSAFEAVSFFTELGTIDYQIWSAFKTKNVGFSDIWNISFGLLFYINNEP